MADLNRRQEETFGSHWSQQYFFLMKMEDLLKTYLSSKKDGCKFMPDAATRSDILY